MLLLRRPNDHFRGWGHPGPCPLHQPTTSFRRGQGAKQGGGERYLVAGACAAKEVTADSTMVPSIEHAEHGPATVAPVGVCIWYPSWARHWLFISCYSLCIYQKLIDFPCYNFFPFLLWRRKMLYPNFFLLH